ncbi:hypothetical protein BV22DRAFT_27375 [Leucogyrophana mollusca]|uniref:Uncharacterized protein n=1 Tax=Leucogyrophana mollusca TaxID=85980 RepID=A0ACB8C1K8_9AGAM|nr:hypothetical protein BV22DRAFT_27375 [Leucogyrophana mollusca]
MTTEASLFFLNRVFQMTVDKLFPQDWLAPPKRQTIWRGIVSPYLRSTEEALSILQSAFPVIPAHADNLTALSAAVSAAIRFITDLYPSLRTDLSRGGRYQLCGRLWEAIEKRPNVSAYWEGKQAQEKGWTITEYGTAEWIAEEARKYGGPSGNSSNL